MLRALTQPLPLPDLAFLRAWPWLRVARISVTAFLALPLLLLAVAGWWDRPIQDDFDYALSAWHHGVWGATVDSWHTWGGRFTAVIAESLTANRLGEQVTPGALLLLLAGGWVLALRALSLPWGRALAGGALVATGTILVCPSITEPLFWRCAATGYFLAVASGGWVVAAVLNRRCPWPLLAGVVVLASGCAEVWSLLLLAALLAAFGVWRGRRLAVALVAGIVGSGLLFLAPGNARRAAQVPRHPALIEALHVSLKYTTRFFSPSWVVGVLPMILLLLALGLLAALLLGDQVPVRVRLRTLLLGGLLLGPLLYALVWLCNFPPVFALGDPPALRTLIIPAFVCAAAAIGYGALVGRWLGGTRYRAALPWLALWAVYQLSAAVPEMPLRELARLQAFGAAMDAREVYIRQEKARGHRDLVVRSLGTSLDFGNDPACWQNGEAARYYGLRTIRTGEAAP